MWRCFNYGFFGFPFVSAGLWWIRPLVSFGLFLLGIFIVYKLFFSRLPLFRANEKGTYVSILRERLAKGEITEDEYKRLKELIEDKWS
ncbi:MAG: SHOCT domain-containing protein [Fervidobacterium sp.]